MPLVTSYFQTNELLFKKPFATAGFGTRKDIPDVYLTQMENDLGDKALPLLQGIDINNSCKSRKTRT